VGKKFEKMVDHGRSKEFRGLMNNHLNIGLAISTTSSLKMDRLLSPYTHLGDVEEIFNPLGVSLGASES
jgi:hypothetical protein